MAGIGVDAVEGMVEGGDDDRLGRGLVDGLPIDTEGAVAARMGQVALGVIVEGDGRGLSLIGVEGIDDHVVVKAEIVVGIGDDRIL